ncbi:uncharacterized protein fam217bb isoform X2 [Mugil cephalus]|uniref:uncharacterized protein fam217bb isoform X2 n=1 Tax=Mugil cephalus TaxID=48193 RepID=UPI001FB73890|nr:uncharacterized protein fam217bb isoform X2 [Mugil cephalus]
MGTIMQERVTQRCPERVPTKEREWKKKTSWSINRLNVARMGRRQSQRKSPQPEYMLPSQENNHDKQRRKHKPNTSSTKHYTPQYSVQGTSESMYHLVCPGEDGMDPSVQPTCPGASSREHKHTGLRRSRYTEASPSHQQSGSSTNLLERDDPKLKIGGLSRNEEEDTDTDLSESERLPASPSVRVPPQLKVRPEVTEAEDCSFHSIWTKGQGRGGYEFPDFLPPPFNSWSLSQLALFYNMEGRGASRPRPVGPLERYLERLLQLEWCQIQTVQEESGKSAVSELISSCHRSPAAASSRLSSPKCILQCQRAFPLTFLSSLSSHSALLLGCACTLCRSRYSHCIMSCCRSTHSHTRQSRVSPMLECSKQPMLLPKRSYSETRVHSSDSSSCTQRSNSPVRTNIHLRRMQASGNMRTPVQGATTRPPSTARKSSDGGGKVEERDYWKRGFRRSGSEHRRGGVERQQNGSEKRRSGSECRKGECRRAAEFKEQEIKPDAVTAIMDNLPGSKYSPTQRPSKPKQVEFLT